MTIFAYASLRTRALSLLMGTAIATVPVLGLSPAALAMAGFSISVDGEHVAGDPTPTDPVRKSDVALAKADIQVTYEGLQNEARLAVGPTHGVRRAEPGSTVPFRLDTNYAQWIDRAEIRVFDEDMKTLLAVLPFTENRVEWGVPAGRSATYHYVARVYDGNGRFDETVPQAFYAGHETGRSVGRHAIWGQDQTAHRSISVHGGAVSVHATALKPGSVAYVLGEPVPVDASGAFVVQRILPAGDHAVDITVEGLDGKSVAFSRDINIPDSEWFYVGLADLTVGARWGEGEIIDAAPEEFDDVYVKGRAAFYLRGKMRGDVLLTAAGDSGEGPLEEMFTGVFSTDPQALLRRIDPNQYYPVYGDDSELVDDAPTSGKLYLRLERGNNHVMWGNFKTEIGDGTMLQAQRTLYGASLHAETASVTSEGRPHAETTLYAAQPQTLPARDTFRGTGGSAYVLRRQDVVPASENISIETLNGVTGMVTSTRRLRAGVDYTINYMQGLIILAEPLSASVRDGGAVSSSESDVANLLVQYEYKPIGTDVQEYAYGGSASTWLGDHVRVGAVGMAETNGDDEDLRVIGVNARVQADADTYLEAEVLHSEGRERGSWLSTDGGFTHFQQPVSGSTNGANAYRVSARTDLGSYFDGSFGLVAGATVEHREEGFSTLDHQVLSDTVSASTFVSAEFGEVADMEVKADHTENAKGERRTEVAAELGYMLNPDWTISVGMIHRTTSSQRSGSRTSGSRTDVGARVDYTGFERLDVYGFGQTSLVHTPGYPRNDRVGGGFEWEIGNGWTAGLEASGGTTGPQVDATVAHADTDGNRSYLGLRMSPDIMDSFLVRNTPANGIVSGAERRISDVASVHAENIYDVFGGKQSLTGLYGVTFTPDERWTASGTYETGTIEDPDAEDFSRHALSTALAYTDGGVEWTGRGELRLEDSDDDTRDRATILGQSGLSVQIDDTWRALGAASAVLSASDQSSILDGEYIEASIGAAYRPVENDRLNALIRYTYLYDLPASDQVSVDGTTMGPAQRSHIFSADANYDLTEWLTIGAKYGFRIGEISETREADDFEASSVHLGVLRADLQVLEDWRVLLEARGLLHAETEVLDLGALAMISYDINDTVRIGAGYNFGHFSDDLRKVEADDHGVFLNVSARY
ncbi:TonB-dependent receptor [Pelagibacterium montanilacus]|uniref:TonB-dependent receptor n=1 Tax=Pelagibacterium montanilacus TaxID=2185280 RepID=UPI000F8CE9ED|nr:TonB-dependent receptor [Pelagibacterium montanilacus]